MPTYLRVTLALSAVVTALCAVVLTVAVLSGNATVRVENLRTFEPIDLSSEVLDQLGDRYPDSGITGFDHGSPPCPASVAIKEGAAFTCTFRGESGRRMDVEVRVEDTHSGALAVGKPTKRP